MPVTISDEPTYYHLLRSGYVIDPDQLLRYINPRMMRRVPDGSEVLVMRDIGLGDVLMVSVAARALAEQWPKLKISLATDSRYLELFRHAAFLHRVVAIASIEGRQEYVLDLRGWSERAPQRHVRDRIEIFGVALGVEVRDFTIPYRVTPQEQEVALTTLGDAPQPTVALAIRGSTRVRTWPMRHVQAFAAMAVERGWGVVLIDNSEHEFPVGGIKNLAGKLGMRGLAAVLAECDLVVAPDTGIVHLGEAVGTPTLAIYSTIDPAVRLSHYQNVQVLWRGHDRNAAGQKELTCCPCWDRGCHDLPCLEGMTPERVMVKACEMLEGASVAVGG
jgi:ADP-heptose:LPS heptosyltransferase